MESNLFRKSSIERISSPEQLNDYLKITNIRIWCILGALFILLSGFVIWGFSGSIPETVQINGVAYTTLSTESADTIYCYLPLATAKRLTTGMEVEVSPDYAARSEHGYIYGKITDIGIVPITEADIIKTFGSLSYVQGVMPEGNALEVIISLEKDQTGLKWSNQKGQKVVLTNGSTCNAQIVINERLPYELILK